MRRNPHKRKNNEGVALILALLFVVLMTVMVIEFSYEAQVEASFAANQGSDFEAYLAAKSAVAYGISLLQADLYESETSGEGFYDSFDDLWATNESFKPLNEALMRTTISDEYAKINLNALVNIDGQYSEPRQEMVNILTQFFLNYDPETEVEAQVIVNAIVDWIDYGDDDDEYGGDGAENDFYQAAEIPYGCKNGPMDSIEELLLIRGITPKLYYGDLEEGRLPLSEYLTVHGDWAGRVNVNTISRFTDDPNAATPQDFVLMAIEAGLGQSELTVSIDALYNQLDQGEPLRDQSTLNGFVTDPNVPPDDDREGRQSPQPVDISDQVFTVSSNVFRIYGDGMVEDTLVRIEAYVWRTPTENWGEFYAPITEPETQSLTPPILQQQMPPEEYFRILDWKVIR